MWRAVFLLFAVAAASESSPAPDLNLGDVFSYDRMVMYLKNLSQDSNGNMILQTLTNTAQNRSDYLVRVSSEKFYCQKKVILLEAASHGNEWITTMTALKTIRELVAKGHEADNYKLLERSDWYILPMVNPDGYEYSLSTQNRDWKKNRSPNGVEFGTNLNRNFDSKWNKSREQGSSAPWSQDFRGNKAFSEPESWAVGDLMQQLVADKREFLYISLHCENKSSIFYPNVFAGNLTKDNATLQAIAQYASDKIWADTEHTEHFNYSLPLAYRGVGGTSLDYAYEQGIPLTFGLEVQSWFLGWLGVFHLAEGALRTLRNCTTKYGCGCMEHDFEDLGYDNSIISDDSEYFDECDDCNPTSAAGELRPLIGAFGAFLTYLFYTLLK